MEIVNIDEITGRWITVRRSFDNAEEQFFLPENSKGLLLLHFAKGSTLYLVDSPVAAKQSTLRI